MSRNVWNDAGTNRHRDAIATRAAKAAKAQRIAAFGLSERDLTPKKEAKPAIDAEQADARAKSAPTLATSAGKELVVPADRTLRILVETALKHGVTVDEIYSQSRKRHLIAARHEVWGRLSTECGRTSAWIGRRFKRDHSTILHALKKFKEGEEPAQ